MIYLAKLENDEKIYSYSDAEHRLIKDLLHDYNKYAHPKSYVNKTVNFTVVFGIEIVQLVAVVRLNFTRDYQEFLCFCFGLSRNKVHVHIVFSLN